jgi:hypothetical protein
MVVFPQELIFLLLLLIMGMFLLFFFRHNIKNNNTLIQNTLNRGPGDKVRHVGDLGNLECDRNGICKFSLEVIVSPKKKTNLIQI